MIKIAYIGQEMDAHHFMRGIDKRFGRTLFETTCIDPPVTLNELIQSVVNSGAKIVVMEYSVKMYNAVRYCNESMLNAFKHLHCIEMQNAVESDLTDRDFLLKALESYLIHVPKAAS